MKRYLIAGLMLASSSAPVLAWGNDGHKAVALVADHYLTAKAKTALAAILGPSDPDMPSDIATRATWADAYRDSSPKRKAETRKWHFSDIQVDGSAGLTAECPYLNTPLAAPFPGKPDDCVVDKIEQFRRELRTPNITTSERQLAVQFLLHFVGDVHQPLHSSDRHDMGGNGTWVVWNQRTVPSKLHGFWDTEAVHMIGSTPVKAAAAAMGHITASTCKQALTKVNDPKSSRDWATQSFQVAKADAYGRIPTSAAGTAQVSTDFHHPEHTETVSYFRLDADYLTHAKADVLDQIALAGLRLAAVLNRELAGQATACPVAN